MANIILNNQSAVTLFFNIPPSPGGPLTDFQIEPGKYYSFDAPEGAVLNITAGNSE